MKDYYETLGLEEGVSLEEITARWIELKKQYQSAPEKDKESDKIIKEINGAYRKLKESVPPSVAFDLEHYREKEAIRSRRAERNRVEKKRSKVILSSAVLVIALFIGLVIFLMQHLK
jgi:DnaJ-class molecular chaperone